MDDPAPSPEPSRPASNCNKPNPTAATKHASNHKLGDFSKLRLVMSTNPAIYIESPPAASSSSFSSSSSSSQSSSFEPPYVQTLNHTRSSLVSLAQSSIDASRKKHISSSHSHVQHLPSASLGDFTSVLDSLEVPVRATEQLIPDLPLSTIANPISPISAPPDDDMAVVNYTAEQMVTIKALSHSPNPFLSPVGQKMVANGCAKSLFRNHGGAQAEVAAMSTSASGACSSSESDSHSTPATSLCGSPNKYAPPCAATNFEGGRPAHSRRPRFVQLKPGQPRSAQHMSLQTKLIRYSLTDTLTKHQHPTVGKNGIYVFLDTSNIQISYTQALKDSLGVDRAVALKPAPALDMEFLTKIMVRDRSVMVKRAGCSFRPDRPQPPVIKELQRLEYDVDVRPRRLIQDGHQQPSASFSSASHSRRNCRCSCHSHSLHHSDSDADTNGRYVEDLVDETLQNRMYESLTENLAAPGTLVLATGDGKPAQFSDGFFAVADRALKAGWNIELVSWRLSLSSAWRDPAWAGKWGDRFRIILLDSFLDELYPSRECLLT